MLLIWGFVYSPRCQSTWAILTSVSCIARNMFSTLHHKGHDFRKYVIEHEMCVSNSSTSFVWKCLILRITEGRYFQILYWSLRKISILFCLTLMKIYFLGSFSKITRVSSSSSSSPIFHGVGTLVDPFRSHMSRSLFKVLPWFLLPVGE
jgi:hypothetical protein